MSELICLVGSGADGILGELARHWRTEGRAVFVCAVPPVCTGRDYDLVLGDESQKNVLEHMAAKSRVLVRVGLHPLTPRLDAGCITRQILMLRPGEGRRIWEELTVHRIEALALLRLMERTAHAVLAPLTEQSVCLRPPHTLPGSDASSLGHAVDAALHNASCATVPLSRLFFHPCPAPLPPALRALSTEVLAMRSDADEHFKVLRDAGHVSATVMLPENLPLPGGRHLAHFMRHTALCPPNLWKEALPDAKDILKLAVARWILKGQAEALECLMAQANKHKAIAHAALLCGTGSGPDGMRVLNEHLKNSPAVSHTLPAFTYAFMCCLESCSQKHVNNLLHTAAGLPRLGGELVWGCSPILNNKYWSQAMRQGGEDSCTLMPMFYDSINAVDDYDLYFHDVMPPWACGMKEGHLLGALLYVALNASVMHMPFRGGVLSSSSLSHVEPDLLRSCGVKSVIIPYGSDAYMYSRLASPTLAHVLNVSYPAYARDEASVCRNVNRWSAQADFVLGWAMTVGNGFPRWDALVVAPFHIDVHGWEHKLHDSMADGHNGRVRILHCPNHRSFKGTDYIIRAVEALQTEGLNVELVLLERMQNSVVRAAMLEVDILVDQCLAHYALNAIEGMASGLPVCSNLEEPDLTVLRRFSYLDECPIVSVTPETLTHCLRPLVRNADLRRRLGEAGRLYVKKYHSLLAARHLYGNIHKKLLSDKNLDIQALYHPLLSEYTLNNPIPRVLDKGHVRPEDIKK